MCTPKTHCVQTPERDRLFFDFKVLNKHWNNFKVWHEGIKRTSMWSNCISQLPDRFFLLTNVRHYPLLPSIPSSQAAIRQGPAGAGEKHCICARGQPAPLCTRVLRSKQHEARPLTSQLCTSILSTADRKHIQSELIFLIETAETGSISPGTPIRQWQKRMDG